jgi:hypothetical protein
MATGSEHKVPGCEDEVAVEEEKENKQQGNEEVGCFEEFIVSIPSLVRLHRSNSRLTHRMRGKDIIVKYACGTRAATPDQ